METDEFMELCEKRDGTLINLRKLVTTMALLSYGQVYQGGERYWETYIFLEVKNGGSFERSREYA